jgi:hypothetical protein
MPFIAVYDANVLYPNTLRDLLIRIAQQPHLVRAKWTELILDEMLRNLQKNLPDVSEEKAARLRGLMNGAVRDCLVEGYEPLIDVLDLPDPDDRHVLAAAIKSGAQVIVTRNGKHFPKGSLTPWGVKAKSPDDFVHDTLDIDAPAIWACIQQIVDSRRQHPVTAEDVISELARDGLVTSAAALRRSSPR